MPGPINALRFVHTAILTESDRVDDAARSASSAADLTPLADDLEFFEELVLLHTRGEEIGLFPVLAEMAPHIDETYLHDHVDERATFTALRAAVDAGDLVEARRSAVVLREHAHSHIEKENTYILPLVDELIEPPRQGEMLGNILSTIPPEKMAEVVPWIIDRIPVDDAERYVGVLEGALPPDAFDAAKGWIRSGVAPDRWSELSRRLPQLAGG